jgi:predicted TIM-barrel fold metal-dependent hydrolase
MRGTRKIVELVALAAAFAGALTAVPAMGQDEDPYLVAEIAKIRAVDNHTHVGKVVGPGEIDRDFDALPCDIIEPGGDVAWASEDNPRVIEAWKALYGYKYDDRKPEHVQELIAARAQVIREQGDNFPTWVLDKLGTQYLFANRVAMGRGLPAPRFRWVPFDDALLTPVASTAVEETPDRKAFYAAEAKILKKYMTEAGASAPPATLEEYVAKVVLPTLESQKKAGAVAVKFEAAYLRTLDFALPREAEARRVYAKYAKAGVPSKEEVLALQDYLFRVMAREAGRLGLAVHLHTGTGCGTYFDVMGANPGNLESVLDDATLRKTTFVLIHGGSGPWTKVAAFLMSKPNVYVDFSEQDAISPPWMLARVIREWLEWYPQKVLYGTDLSPGPPEVDWDVVGYVTNGTARQALAVALTGMVHDGDITRGRAVEIARMVLRENGIKLYGLGD